MSNFEQHLLCAEIRRIGRHTYSISLLTPKGVRSGGLALGSKRHAEAVARRRLRRLIRRWWDREEWRIPLNGRNEA